MEQMRRLQLLPLGTSDFAVLRQRNQIYVDKTDLVFKLASLPEKFFIARPRRFGKSLLISTFESLFKYGLRDFKGLAIEKLWREDKTYQVIKLDFSRVKNFRSFQEFVKELDNYLIDVMLQLSLVSPFKTKTEGLRAFINWLDVQTSNSVVLLIDEYDAPLTACLNDATLFNSVRSQLAKFYSVVKSNDSAIRFFFTTGITKFNKTSIFSELNNLSDLTLDPTYGSLLGYTHTEVEKYFDGYLEQAANVLRTNKDSLLRKLTKHYDGFCFEMTAKQKVFSPWSLLKFLASPQNGLIDYWFGSGGNPTVLVEYMRSHSFKNPEEYAKEKTIPLVNLSYSSDVQNLSDIGLLIQTGYLTLKKVVGTTAYVDYPNDEVRTAIAQLYMQQLLAGRTVEEVGADNIVHRLQTENAESILHLLNRLVESIDYKDYPINTESSVRALVQVFFSGAGLRPIVEHHNAHGRSDLEVDVVNRHWVFEFKVVEENRSADDKLEEAVQQIVTRNYGSSFQDREMFRLALIFSIKERKFIRWQVVLPSEVTV